MPIPSLLTWMSEESTGIRGLLLRKRNQTICRRGWRYYQGKRRIPAPACITRHWGETDLPTLATEILGLSKMNWNSFDMYAQLPATVQSSKHIANIGSLLERFNDHSFDYRLFI